MIQIIYSVYDVKAQAYLPPFFLHTNGMAKRVFADCCQDQQHQFGKNPHDYTLFQLGAFDDATAKIKLENAPISLGNGLEFQVENVDPRQNVLDLDQHRENPDAPHYNKLEIES